MTLATLGATAVRFLREGIRDADYRLAISRSPIEPECGPVIRGSAIFRLVDGGRAFILRIADSSAAVAAVQTAATAWREAGLGAQRRSSGLVLVIASLVHCVLMWWRQPTAGWISLILPGVAAALGVLLLAAARADGRSRPK